MVEVWPCARSESRRNNIVTIHLPNTELQIKYFQSPDVSLTSSFASGMKILGTHLRYLFLVSAHTSILTGNHPVIRSVPYKVGVFNLNVK